MVDPAQICFLLPIRGLPYTMLLKEVMFILWSISCKQEQTSVSKIIMGLVNKTIILTIDYYIKGKI